VVQNDTVFLGYESSLDTVVEREVQLGGLLRSTRASDEGLDIEKEMMERSGAFVEIIAGF
jgi:hypothetical protein